MDSVKYNDKVDERIFFKRLSNGMKCYIIPKLGYVEKQAMLGINYGSVDYVFSSDGKEYVQPAGVAHFIEHKMFEDKEVNVFEQFMGLKASVNAFTNFTSTAYYFNSSENFYESLKLLLEFVGRPYFTDENVEKEKPIIAQEIEMYEDNPFWVMYFNLLGALYKESPIRQKIAGSVEGIQEISPEILYQGYRAFYRPDNMVLCCVGEVEPELAAEAAEKWVPHSEPMNTARLYGKEPSHVIVRHAEKRMALARPMFQLGFKDSDFDTAYTVKSITTKILLDMLFGESSDFFERSYSEGLVDGPFVLEYSSSSFYGTAVCSNSADCPHEVAGHVLGKVERVKSEGLDEKRFAQIQRKHLGRFIRNLNSIEGVSHGQMELAFRGLDLFDILRTYQNVTFAQVSKRFERLFRDDNYATSVIMPDKK